MEKTVNEVINNVAALNEKFAGDKSIKEFEKAIEQFEELVRKGLTTKRGNHLLPKAEMHIKSKVTFNLK